MTNIIKYNNELKTLLFDLSKIEFCNNDDKNVSKIINKLLKTFSNYFKILAKSYDNDIKDNNLKKYISYALLSNGKRFRAFIIYLIAFCYSIKNFEELVNPYILAIEYIHAFSLAHDDLPSIDNDEYRRGKLSTWKKFGEANAVLTGDALLNNSYKIVLDNINSKMIDKNVLALSILSKSTLNMIIGELDDTIFGSIDRNAKKIKKMYENKTSNLLIASFMIPAVFSNNYKKDSYLLYNIANTLGFSYQIVDDLFAYIDCDEISNKIGKDVKSDLKNNKITYVSKVGLEKSKKILEKNKNEIFDNIDKLSIKKDNKNLLKHIIYFILNRDY